LPSGAAAIPTIGELSDLPLSEPLNRAPPNANTPPAAAPDDGSSLRRRHARAGERDNSENQRRHQGVAAMAECAGGDHGAPSSCSNRWILRARAPAGAIVLRPITDGEFRPMAGAARLAAAYERAWPASVIELTQMLHRCG
jgi:hypothetical protein